MTSLFGGNANSNNTNQTTGGSLFGSSTAQGAGGGSSSGGGLFGSAANTTQQSNTGGSLFGNTNNATSNASGGGLFGSSTVNNQQGNNGTSLFGAKTNTGTGGGLFGTACNSNTNQSTGGGGGLFGGNTSTNQANNTGGGGLFGTSTTQNQNTGTSSLFGQNQNTSNNNNASSLFGGTNQNTSNNNAGTSLFGKPAGGNTSLFSGANTQQQQQQQQQGSVSSASVFNPQTVSVGNLGHTMTGNQFQRLQYAGASTVPNEKKISQQIQTIAKKWSPDAREDDTSQTNPRRSTILQTYLYNAVPKEYAPFFYPDFARGEDEKSWEEALSQKPELPSIDGQEVTSLAYVPILVVGFRALGERVETQAKIVQEMRSRLHEMNNSLSAVMEAHQQRITVRIATAKRQHQVLSQRCLKLAVKVQVLRNRGYALDAQEEGLRKTLMHLERQVTDPGFIGREDEIWARMVALRERARWLEEEGKRVSAQVEQNQQPNGAASTGVSEAVLAKTRKILKDYDGQLQHLNKELEEVKREYSEWEQTRNRR